MKLPPPPNLVSAWPNDVEAGWSRLLAKTERFAQSAGGGDAFDAMCGRLRRSVERADLTDIYDAIEKRLGARALTWLWNNEKGVLKRSCRSSVINALVERQKPRLTRTTLLQLGKLYFEEFDQLDQVDNGLFSSIEAVVRSQVLKIPQKQRDLSTRDPIVALQKNLDWLIGVEGPAKFSDKVRESGEELEQRFEAFGLVGYDAGRYGDLCRAHYYIKTLNSVALGQWDPVFDELLKPSVSRAPFGEDKRIGHAALEVIIDRAGSEVSEAWQDFVIGIAGDPRIKSSSRNYQEWWKPLGAARVEKVRGWLSRQDLKLFLQALEQYGLESGDAGLKRMFPARKRFLEGLYNQKLIRNTRLMLGRRTEGIVKRLLGDEIKTNFANLEGGLSDKAIIYVDCGDFHLVEGSHNFKIWVYLAQPGKIVGSYDHTSFTPGELTHTTPAQYKAMYNLPYDAVTHNGTWQSKVINFLAEQGIELDIESLLSTAEYRGHLAIHGYPVVKSPKAWVPEPKELPEHLKVLAPHRSPKRTPPSYEDLSSSRKPTSAADKFLRGSPSVSATDRDGARSQSVRTERNQDLNSFSEQQKTVLGYLAHNPRAEARHVAALLGFTLKELVAMFAGPLAPYVKREDMHTWVVKPEFIHKFK